MRHFTRLYGSRTYTMYARVAFSRLTLKLCAAINGVCFYGRIRGKNARALL